MKKVLVIILLLGMLIGLAGCSSNNDEWFAKKEAYIFVDGEWILVNVEKWEYCGIQAGMVKIYTDDGITYTTHVSNVVILEYRNLDDQDDRKE